ncbi:MAG: hypothetical protein Q8Q11_01230 [bacterium]|nr:hypothetical protein [bacterium]MDZ4247753.1 hypothetical protein [Patescibacteria group bacterium]
MPMQKLITVHRFETGGGTAYLFEQEYGKAYTLRMGSSLVPELVEVERVDQRIFPRIANWNNDRHVEPALVIRAKDDHVSHPSFSAASIHTHAQWFARTNTWFAVQCGKHRGTWYSAFGQNNRTQWMDGKEVTDFELDEQCVRYTSPKAGRMHYRFDYLFDYVTGEVLHQPAVAVSV